MLDLLESLLDLAALAGRKGNRGRDRQVTSTTVVRARLDAAIGDRRLLDHPFYKAWAAGELRRDDLGFYSTQYWRQVETFPTCLRAVASGLEDSRARRAVEENLSDELDGDHAGLWQAFAEALGINGPELDSADIDPETIACVDAFTAGTKERSPAFSLGMLYGYESQTPEVATTKVEGLRSFYGISGAATEYFVLHGELDVEHSSELVGAIAEVAGDGDDLVEAEAGARAGADAIWTLLDGVERVRTSTS
ncbi:MAG: TenA family transcriptional regulator [Actinomycetota bacterium]